MSAGRQVRLSQREVDILFARVVCNETRPLPARLNPRARLTPSKRVQRNLLWALVWAVLFAGYCWASTVDYAAAGGVR